MFVVVARVSLSDSVEDITVPRVIFKNSSGASKIVNATDGQTVMRAAQANGVGIEGACEGSIACSTCHVIVDNDWFLRLEPASEEEEDLLDLAAGLTPNSRLGCQIVITEMLNGLEVTLPDQTIDMSDI